MGTADAAVPAALVPMKQPRTATFAAATDTVYEKPWLKTRPFNVESAPLMMSPCAPGMAVPSTTIFRTALMAPVALVLGDAPVCV